MPTYLIYGDVGDGFERHSWTDYATARESGGSFGFSTTATTGRVGQRYASTETYPYYVVQTFIGWDTTIIPDDETILSATAEFRILSDPNEIDVTVEGRVHHWVTPVSSADWVPASQITDTSYPLLFTHTFPALDGRYWSFTQDITAHTRNNAFTGIMFNDQKQVVGTAPTSATQYVRPYTADYATYSFKPLIEVETNYTFVEAAPAVILTQTNLTGDITTVQNDPAVSDGIWMTAVSHTADTELRLGFDVLPAGKRFDVVQKFTYRGRASSTDETEVEVHLYEAGIPRGHLATHLVTPTEETFTIEWAPELLSNPAADNVEIRFFTPFITKASSPEFESVRMSARYVDDVAITPTVPKAQTNFSTTAIGTQPAGWAHQWHVPDVSKVMETVDASAGQALVLEDDTGQRRGFVWTDGGSAVNIDALVRVKFNVHFSNSLRLYGRTGGLASSETGIFSEIFNYNDTREYPQVFRLGVYYSGNFTAYAEKDIPTLLADEWYIFRLRLFGNTYRAKFWREGDIEPPWILDVQSTPEAVATAGPLGIGSYGSYNQFVIDAVSVAFDGETPNPLPAVGSKPFLLPPSTPVVQSIQTDDGVLVSWDAVPDVAGYKVIRDGKLLVTTTDLSYLDTEVMYDGESVLNGRGELGSLTNFSGFTSFTDGGFEITSTSATLFSDEYIPVDPTVEHLLHGEWRGNPGVGQRHYVGLATYDAQKLHIEHYMISRRATGVLAQDLKPGDTLMYLTDATGWENAGVGHQRTLQLFPYIDSAGKRYDFLSGYSRNVVYDGTNGAWAAGGIATNVVTLNKPLELSNPEHSLGYWVAGSEVANTQSGGTFLYSLSANEQLLDSGWKSPSRKIIKPPIVGTNSDLNFRPGTAFVRMLFLANRGLTSPSSTIYRNLSFKKPVPAPIAKGDFMYGVTTYRNVV